MQSGLENLGLTSAAAAEIFLLTAICVVLLVDVLLSDRQRWITYVLSLLSIAGAAMATVRYGVEGRVSALRRHVRGRSNG